MAGRKYDKLKIEDFGRSLVTTGDLDPIYIVLDKMEKKGLLSGRAKCRWLLSYWCFYSAGSACHLSGFEGEAFWTEFMIAAANRVDTPCPIAIPNGVNGGWPRAKERRHFRGIQAIKATDELRAKYPTPEDWVGHLLRAGDPARLTYAVVSKRVQEWRGFGQWISYKVADMLDRCAIHPVDFAFDDAMYADPTEAALMQWRVMHGAPADSTIDDPKAAVREVVGYLLSTLGDLKAPPFADRPIGYQEIETVLCKWKSHMKGHYPLHNDLYEIAEGVQPWLSYNITAGHFGEEMLALVNKLPAA